MELDLEHIDLGSEVPFPKDYMQAKVLLQSIQSAKTNETKVPNPNGPEPINQNLYEHLIKMLKYFLEIQPQNGLDQFEEISYQIKRNLDTGLNKEDIQAKALDVEKPLDNYLFIKSERGLFTVS